MTNASVSCAVFGLLRVHIRRSRFLDHHGRAVRMVSLLRLMTANLSLEVPLFLARAFLCNHHHLCKLRPSRHSPILARPTDGTGLLLRHHRSRGLWLDDPLAFPLQSNSPSQERIYVDQAYAAPVHIRLDGIFICEWYHTSSNRLERSLDWNGKRVVVVIHLGWFSPVGPPLYT